MFVFQRLWLTGSLLIFENAIIVQVSKQFFQQAFRFIDSVLFNVLLLRKDLCTSRRASEIHSNISRLEGWLAETAGDEWVGPLNNHLHYMRQVRPTPPAASTKETKKTKRKSISFLLTGNENGK
jgi:hypothetical protein